jgi:hypothetical protein
MTLHVLPRPAEGGFDPGLQSSIPFRSLGYDSIRDEPNRGRIAIAPAD